MFSSNSKIKLVPFSANLNLGSSGDRLLESDFSESSGQFDHLPPELRSIPYPEGLSTIYFRIEKEAENIREKILSKKGFEVKVEDLPEFKNMTKSFKDQYNKIYNSGFEKAYNAFKENSETLKSKNLTQSERKYILRQLKKHHSDMRISSAKIEQLRKSVYNFFSKLHNNIDHVIIASLRSDIMGHEGGRAALEYLNLKNSLGIIPKPVYDSVPQPKHGISMKSVPQIDKGLAALALGSAALVGYGLHKSYNDAKNKNKKDKNRKDKNKKQESSPHDHPYQLGRSLIHHLQDEHRNRSI